MFFEVLKHCQSKQEHKHYFDELYNKTKGRSHRIVKNIIVGEKELQEFAQEFNHRNTLYNVLIKGILNKALNNTEDFIAFLKSYHGEDSPEVGGEELHKMLVNV